MRFALPFERDFARASSPISDFVAARLRLSQFKFTPFFARFVALSAYGRAKFKI